MLNENIKKYRQNTGWTQQKLAEKTGLSYNTISKLEQGTSVKAEIQTLIKIADAFNISLDDLVGRKLLKKN